MTRTITSPAGEDVTVYPDSEWIEMTGVPPQALAWTRSRRAVLGALWCQGKFTDKSGRASRLLIDAAKERGYKPDSAGAFGALITSQSMAPSLARDINGKRTYRIQLAALPETWAQHLPVNGHVNGHVNGTTVIEVEPEPTPETSEPPAGEPEAPAVDLLDVYQPTLEPDALELQVSMAVARSLLTQVVEIIAAGPEIREVSNERTDELERDLSIAHQRLSSRLEENDKLRRRIRILEDELSAAHSERDGLRGRLKAAEYNLEKAMSADNQRFIMAEVHREVDKMMRAKPASDKGTE
jgi:hypothetical protein